LVRPQKRRQFLEGEAERLVWKLTASPWLKMAIVAQYDMLKGEF
jgi:hypothetical protein